MFSGNTPPNHLREIYVKAREGDQKRRDVK
jgi:hypothetical protein